jgi:hypothetical protein
MFAEQQSLITVNRLPTKKNKRPFSISVCSTRIGYAVSIFHLQKLNESCRFLTTIFRLRNSGTWRHGHGDMETWRHGNGDMEMETWKHGELEPWRHGHGDIKRKVKDQAI